MSELILDNSDSNTPIINDQNSMFDEEIIDFNMIEQKINQRKIDMIKKLDDVKNKINTNTNENNKNVDNENKLKFSIEDYEIPVESEEENLAQYFDKNLIIGDNFNEPNVIESIQEKNDVEKSIEELSTKFDDQVTNLENLSNAMEEITGDIVEIQKDQTESFKSINKKLTILHKNQQLIIDILQQLITKNDNSSANSTTNQ